VRFAVVLAATASCRQIAGIQDLPKPCADPLTIDDMEDGDGFICKTNGRQGGWFSFGDGTSSNQMFVVGALAGRGGSRRGVHFTGSGFTDWGAILGLNLDSDGINRNAYHAPGVGGLTFWMKSTVPVTVEALTEATVLVANGGQCDENVTPQDCNDHFSFQITGPDAGWKQYEIPFSALRQTAGGTATWDPTQLLGFQFLAGPHAAFDVWIDDVAFYYCATPECLPTCADPKFPVRCAKSDVHPAGCYPPPTTCDAVDNWCADPNLLDDMEDGDAFICHTQGRQSGWYTFGDSKARFEMAPIPGGRSGSNYAAHLTGSHLTDWGAGMGFGLKASGRATYDASAVGGITFWMKGTARTGVQLRLPATTPMSNPPGTCTNGFDCDLHYHFSLGLPGDTWTEYRVPFAALRQGSRTGADGNFVPGSVVWDPSQLVAIEFPVGSADFDLWIDDVRFYTCEGSACVPSCNAPDRPVACPATAGHPAHCWPAGTDCATQPDTIRLFGAWGSGPDDVWAVGFSDFTLAGAVFHFDGIRWTRADVGAVPPLWDVAGTPTGDVSIVGDHGTVLRLSGSGWMKTIADTDASLNAVWMNSTSDTWATAYPGTVRHWDGATWSTSKSVSNFMVGLWGSGANDVWAAGDGGTILHYDGNAWSAPASSTTVFLNRLWGTGPDDVWAVGDSGPVLHFDGTRWSASAGITGGFLGVCGSATDDVWAVGYEGAIAHWNGSAWSSVASPVTTTLWDVWGSSRNDVWAVGDENTILHFDGSRWTPVAVSETAP
jgi:hypothetical protein